MHVIAGKLGNYISVCIPPELASQLQIAPGTRLTVTSAGGKLIIEPVRADMANIVNRASFEPEK